MNKYNEIKTALHGGLKTNNYRVYFNIPLGNTQLDKSGTMNYHLNLLCQSASYPSRKVNSIDVWCRGRKVVLRGNEDVTSAWSCTFVENSDAMIRTLFENWLMGIDSQNNSTIWKNYVTDIRIVQLNPEGEEINGYTLKDAFVTDIAQVDFTDESPNLVKFAVTFAYSNAVPFIS